MYYKTFRYEVLLFTNKQEGGEPATKLDLGYTTQNNGGYQNMGHKQEENASLCYRILQAHKFKSVNNSI